MKRIFVSIGSVLMFVVLGCVSLWAQATAQISGTVRDQSGAVLPGVEITATQTGTGIARTAVSNETGSFGFPNLAIGPYRLEASLPGFRTFVQSGIVLQVNSNPSINPVLEVGQVSEQVEVQANAALVETRSQGVGSVMENERILELPLNGRQVTDLIELSGAATPAAVGQGAKNFQRNGAVSIAGGMGTGVAYFLDGAVHSQFTSGGNLSTPFPDALQEFKVETSALSAHNGMHSAGAVTMVTKSGTNEFHGDLFEFVRNGIFNARNVFATRRDTLKRNQFGGTVGGPIRSNKLFFFAGYQGTTTRRDPVDTISFVPTAAMMAGDFTTITSPACNNGRQIALRAPFVNNRVDPSQFSPAVLKILAHADMPKSADPCGRLVWGNPLVVNDHMAIGRIDYQWTSSHSLFGRYLIDASRGPAPYTITHNLLSTGTVGADAMAQSFTLGSTYLIGPNVVNALRLTGNRTASENEAADYFSMPDIGVKAYLPSGTGRKRTGRIGVTGGPTIGGAIMGGPLRGNFLGGNDDVSWAKGTHQFAFGVAGGRFTNTDFNKGVDMGELTINGQITGLGMADFMTGNVAMWEQASVTRRDEYKWYFGTYGEDTWKATPKLTVNYGVRWEPFFPQTFVNGDSVFFDRDKYVAGTRSTVYKNSPPGLVYSADPGTPGKGAMFTKWANFSPRLGLAWDPRGNGDMSVRASYGMFYDFSPLSFFTGRRPAFLALIDVFAVKFDDPFATFPGGNPFPADRPGQGIEGKYYPRALYTSIPHDTKNPSISQWNLSFQKQLGPSWLASASYMGSSSVHLWSVRALNYAQYIPGASCVLNGITYSPCSTTGNTDQRRLLSLLNPVQGEFFGNVNGIDDGATSSYHGLLLSAQRRAARGVTLNVNYTWSHCISDLFFVQMNTNPSAANLDQNNRRYDRGDCIVSGQDRRQLFNVTAVAEAPSFANPTLKMIASGWRLAPIVRISSGTPLTVVSGTDVALTGLANQRPNQLLGNVYLDKKSTRYLNPSAFQLPATGTLGNVGVATVRGPVTWQFDASLSRTFQIRESQKVEIRAEAFNVTNSFRRGNPTLGLNSNTFGQITTALDPRIMQFALKYVF